MLVFQESGTSNTWLIPQVSLAWTAWQIVRHWGRRHVLRPSPRAETEAAVMLQAAAFSEYDASPELNARGEILSFDRMNAAVRLKLFRRSLRQIEEVSRYAAVLLARHYSRIVRQDRDRFLRERRMAEARKAHAFAAEMEALEAGWFEQLSVDPRYAPALEGTRLDANTEILSAVSRMATGLFQPEEGDFTVQAFLSGDQPEVIRVSRRSSRCVVLRPWPIEGRGIKVHCEALKLRTSRFSTPAECRSTLATAPRERLSFRIIPPGNRTE